MFASKQRLFGFIATFLVAFFATSTVNAKVVINTIDTVASVSDDGRHLVVTGPLSCTAGERAYLRVTVTQRTTGAIAEGSTLVVCTGTTQEWEVHAAIQSREAFQAGAAVAVASARTTERGNTTDAHQWLVAITLVDE
jgi:hypothetical protein